MKLSKLEIALLIEKCSYKKFELNKIKDETLKVLIEAIINSRQSKVLIKELTK